MGGALLEQAFIVEYIIANQMCDDCHRAEAQNHWRALVRKCRVKFRIFSRTGCTEIFGEESSYILNIGRR